MYSDERSSPDVPLLAIAFALSMLLCSTAASRCWYSDRQWPTARGPADIAADSSGYIYVVCHSDHRIQKFTGGGNLVAQWGQYGVGPGQFDGPQGIAVDASGMVYVADTNNRRIQKFRPDGSFAAQWNTYAKDLVRSFRPFGVATDFKGDYVYVSDVQNQRVLKFASDGSSVRAWSSYGASSRKFNTLGHLATDKLGFVYVADSGASALKKFTNLGSFRDERRSSARTNLVIPNPIGIAVDYSGYVFLTDANHCVQQLDHTLRRTGWFGGCADSEYEHEGHWHEITSPHDPKSGSGPGQFSRPQGVAADPTGNLYIADFDNHRIQKLVTLQTSGISQPSSPEVAPGQRKWRGRGR